MKIAQTIAVVMLTLGSVAAFAADVTGKWTAQFDTPNGAITLTYDLKQDGAKLTGSVQGPQGEPLKIQDGKIDGDKISFSVTFAGPDGEFKIANEGVIKGDEISLSAKIPDAPDGGPPPLTLKRVK
jgi:hypothetical protein